jgi:hypothetical protein
MEPTPDRMIPRADTPPRVPSWLRSDRPENRLPVLVAILVAVALQRAVPEQYTVVPRWPLIVLELLLVLVLVVNNPLRLSRRNTLARWGSIGLTAAITIDTIGSAAVLDYRILSGEVSNDPAVLLGSGGAIYITNMLVFALWYWELDRGGPFARASGDRPYPDFLFPQMTDPRHARPGWRPTFVDYLYVSFTNGVAFSPTDTMPLARWAKMMMAVQALVATSTIVLVIARAVNVLN